MTQTTRFAAQIVESSASAYAGYAASLLLDRHPDVLERSGRSAMRDWKAYLTARLHELGAALAVDEPAIFAARVRWENQAFLAREGSNDDLGAALDCLLEVLTEELPATARDTVVAYLEPARAVLLQNDAPLRLDPDPGDPEGMLALRYLRTVLEGDGRAALDLIATARADGMAVRDLYLGVLLAAQRQVGHLWHRGELGIAEEHFVTTTTERAMAILAQSAPRPTLIGKTVVAAAVAGNTHGLGIRVLADFFELAGWRSICLGANVPPTEIAAAVVHFDANVVALSANLAIQLNQVSRTVEAVRGLPAREVHILVGGGAFDEAPNAWRRFGADGYAASVDDALRTAAHWADLDAGAA